MARRLYLSSSDMHAAAKAYLQNGVIQNELMRPVDGATWVMPCHHDHQ